MAASPFSFGGYLIGWCNMTHPTPTGDTQNGADAVMPLAMPPAAPASDGQAPAVGVTLAATLPRTSGESFLSSCLASACWLCSLVLQR